VNDRKAAGEGEKEEEAVPSGTSWSVVAEEWSVVAEEWSVVAECACVQTRTATARRKQA